MKKTKHLKSIVLPFNSNMRRIIFSIIGLLMIASAFAVRECVYDPRGFTFHCSNNMPGTSIGPGQEGEITIVCCFTGREYQDSDEQLEITAEVIYNWAHRIQNPDGSWTTLNDTYPASDFITGIDYPNMSKGFETFPVTIHYSLPEESALYQPGVSIPSRVDIQVVTGKGVVPNNAVYPQIRIPDDWTPESVDLVPMISGGAVIGLLSVFSVSVVRKKKKRSRMNEAKKL